jgi:hypothetical protein
MRAGFGLFISFISQLQEMIADKTVKRIAG